MGATVSETTTIQFGGDVSNLSKLTDEAFLNAISWNSDSSFKTTSGSLKLADQLQKKWRNRINGSHLKRSNKLPFSSWSRGSFPATGLTEKLETLVAVWSPKKSSNTISQLMTLLQESPADFPECSAYDLLLVTELLLISQATLSPQDFWALWRWTASQFLAISAQLETFIGTEATPDQIVILSGEVPWLGGLLFPEIAGAKEFRKAGKKTLKQALAENIDNDGTPNAPLLDRADFWVASLVRSAHWGALNGKSLWKGDHESLYDSLLESLAQLSQTEGHLALTTDSPELNRPDLPDIIYRGMIASGFSPKSKSVRFMSYLREGSVKKSSQALIDSRKWGQVKKSISNQSDWSQLACLRSGWSLDSDSIIITHHNEIPEMALSVLGKTLATGDWELELKVRGRQRKLSADWNCTCWYSDREVDYLELHLDLTDDLHLDRQVFLSRSEHFALLVDSVAGAKNQKFELTSRLPLVSQVQSETDQLTREIRLKCGDESIRALPLGLPQYRTHSATGEFTVQDGKLELKQTGESAGVSPLFLDWSPRRRRFKADWRTVTITENRRSLLPKEAFAARVRFKNQQWLYYSDLINDKEWPHAVLGMHTNHETVFGRFDSGGDVQPIVHVE